ncbi:MAG: EscU/YscU/HrcU family type III secretion system export apparatus switch protein [Proteobacteria bacterium]|nr:MAG: EscU/YscU/HrcU family type III secretion system export apparatus switch protein [Pseudomonadota bacterium]
MADRPGGEPTEPPSEKKLRDARQKGDVAKSRELVSAAVFLLSAGAVVWAWPTMLGQLRAYLQGTFANAAIASVDIGASLTLGLKVLALVSAPVLAAAFLGALLSSYAQVGTLFSLKPLAPQLARLDPLKNAKNMLGKRALVELAKSLVKVFGIGGVAFYTLWQHAPQIVRLAGHAPERALAASAACLGQMAMRVGLLALALAIADLLYQRHTHRKKLRMTKEEVKREAKESEGDPQHKAERQRLHQEIVAHQRLESVATADCVIINPTEIAVALRYDAESMDAPQVVASGRRLQAHRIRQIARRHGVPIVRNVPLARALIELELEEEIPTELYEAVAEVLRFVHAALGDDDNGEGERGAGENDGEG